MRRRKLISWLWLAAALGIGSGTVTAQDDEPPPKKPGVQIVFLPPPMEGTLSLGIYNPEGKLVRVLAREATEKDFVVGLNGFITQWDGRDDSGQPLPAGTYVARGYSVGALEVEGMAYHGNDWMLDDDSPRLQRVLSLALGPGGKLRLWAEGADGQPRLVRCDQTGDFHGDIPPEPSLPALAAGDAAAAELPARAEIVAGKVQIVEGAGAQPLELPELSHPLDASLGRDGVWVIDQAAAGVEVKEYSRAGEFQRRLVIDPAEPTPRRIFASRTSDLIFLIEEKPGLQRVRGLALEAAPTDAGPPAGPTTSTWKTVLSKAITASPDFAAVADKLGRIMPFIPRAQFTAKLLPNPLLQDAMTEVHVTIGFDGGGSFLQTTDGLPLRRITAAPHLHWAVIGQEGSGKQLTIFQGDGAVVEEFRAHKLANMMAFDAGRYEWAGK